MIAETVLPYKIEKSKELITPRTGLLIFGEFLNSLGLKKLVNKLMPQPESNRGYEPYKYIQSLILMLYGGGRSIADVREIRQDIGLREVLKIEEMPSESAIGDWLRTASGRNGISKLNEINLNIIKKVIGNKRKKITLVFDPTIIFAEKREAQMTYKGFKGYRPHIAFIPEFNLIVNCEFRDGNDMGRRLDFIKETIEKLPSNLDIDLFLADSEFYQKDVIEYLNQLGIEWIISADQDCSVKESILTIENWTQFIDKDNVATNREIGDTVHIMNNLKKSFRLVVQKWIDSKGQLNYHCIATSIEKRNARNIVLNYNKRANSENNIKELKIGFNMERMPCGTKNANALFFGIGILTYNIFIAQKTLTMPEKKHSLTIESIRWSIVEIASSIKTSINSFVIEACATLEKINLFKYMRRKNYELFVAS